MKRLSLWAYQHKWAARLLIVLCYILLNAIGFLIGDLLQIMEVQVSSFLVYLLATVVFVAMALYPSRKEKDRYRNFYARQKTCDGLLITATFLLIISAANLRHTAYTPFQFPSAQAVVPVTVAQPETITVKKKEKKRSFFRAVKTKLTKAFQKVRNYYRSLSNGERILLLMLVGILAGVALMGVAAWSCNLSCAGSEGAAAAVLLSGLAVVIFLIVVAARAINRSYRRGRE